MFFSFNNYVNLRYIQLSFGNRTAIFLGKICQLCLPSVHLWLINRICLYFSMVLWVVVGARVGRERA